MIASSAILAQTGHASPGINPSSRAWLDQSRADHAAALAASRESHGRLMEAIEDKGGKDREAQDAADVANGSLGLRRQGIKDEAVDRAIAGYHAALDRRAEASAIGEMGYWLDLLNREAEIAGEFLALAIQVACDTDFPIDTPDIKDIVGGLTLCAVRRGSRLYVCPEHEVHNLRAGVIVLDDDAVVVAC